MKASDEFIIMQDTEIVASTEDFRAAIELVEKHPGTKMVWFSRKEYSRAEIRRYFPEWFDG